MINSGFISSNLLGAPVFSVLENSTFPESCDLREELKAPEDQGNRNICVSICVSDMVGYIHTVLGKKYRKRADFYFNRRRNKTVDGMSPREAFEIAQDNELARAYAILRTEKATKVSIVANGPALVGLPVYNFGTSFWVPSGNLQGYHAVTLVGFDNEREAFILRNSWGVEWGDQGYTCFPYKDYDSIIEAWTLYR